MTSEIVMLSRLEKGYEKCCYYYYTILHKNRRQQNSIIAREQKEKPEETEDLQSSHCINITDDVRDVLLPWKHHFPSTHRPR